MDQNLVNIASAVIVIGGAVGVIWGVLRPVVKKIRTLMSALDRFIVDWFGEDAGPGRDAVPGVMERLNKIDGELKHNGGSTMKDAISRVEQKLTQIDERLEQGNQRFVSAEKRINKLEKGDK